MNATPILTILFGLFLRLIVPLAVTALIVYWLRKLDARWQEEAEKEYEILLKDETPCWIEQGFTIEESRQRAEASEQPCWQIHRSPNGHLLEACLECEVFRSAPESNLKSRHLKTKRSHAHV
jgi:hypothetical protein